MQTTRTGRHRGVAVDSVQWEGTADRYQECAVAADSDNDDRVADECGADRDHLVDDHGASTAPTVLDTDIGSVSAQCRGRLTHPQPDGATDDASDRDGADDVAGRVVAPLTTPGLARW